MKITSLDSIDAGVTSWKEQNGINKIIAISGGSSAEKIDWADPEIVEKLNKSVSEYVNAVIEGALKKLRDYRIAILTGGTKWGVPEDAIRLAKSYGFPTIGYIQPDEQRIP